MAELICTNMEEDFWRICRWVRDKGDEVSPRGQRTREILNASLEFEDPTRMLPVGCGRGVNAGIAVVEALQLIGGFCDPALITRASSVFTAFMDQGNFHGGYGLRTRMQIAPAIERLLHDPDSRQAVITMWDPLHDAFVDDAHDYPCTISLQFMIRNDKLDLHTHMRSNDVWRGLAYDAFVFTQLQMQVAVCLGRPLGRYFHHAASLHLYEVNGRDVNDTRRRASDEPVGRWTQPLLHDHYGPTWPERQRMARDIVYRHTIGDDDTAVRWYAEKIAAIG